MTSRKNTKYDELFDTFLESKTKKNIIEGELKKVSDKLETNLIDLDESKQAREIIQTAAEQTQNNIKIHLSNIVSLALKSVFTNPPEFLIEIEKKRNQTEVNLLFDRYGNKSKLKMGSAGGLLDVTSFALRISIFMLNRKTPIMILDEPFKFVSPSYQEKVGEMLKEISDKLKIQMIVVSHQNDVNIKADKTFKVTKKDKVSEVVEL